MKLRFNFVKKKHFYYIYMWLSSCETGRTGRHVALSTTGRPRARPQAGDSPGPDGAPTAGPDGAPLLIHAHAVLTPDAGSQHGVAPPPPDDHAGMYLPWRMLPSQPAIGRCRGERALSDSAPGWAGLLN